MGYVKVKDLKNGQRAIYKEWGNAPGITYYCPKTEKWFFFNNHMEGEPPEDFSDVCQGYRYSWWIANKRDENVYYIDFQLSEHVGKFKSGDILHFMTKEDFKMYVGSSGLSGGDSVYGFTVEITASDGGDNYQGKVYDNQGGLYSSGWCFNASDTYEFHGITPPAPQVTYDPSTFKPATSTSNPIFTIRNDGGMYSVEGHGSLTTKKYHIDDLDTGDLVTTMDGKSGTVYSKGILYFILRVATGEMITTHINDVLTISKATSKPLVCAGDLHKDDYIVFSNGDSGTVYDIGLSLVSFCTKDGVTKTLYIKDIVSHTKAAYVKSDKQITSGELDSYKPSKVTTDADIRGDKVPSNKTAENLIMLNLI